MTPALDLARVRALLEQLCDLEPEFFWRTDGEGGIGAYSELGAGSAAYAVQIMANGDAKIHVPTIRDALEALHDARGWCVTVCTFTYGDVRESRCRIVMLGSVWREVTQTASTRLEALLESTVKALGGAL